MSITYWCCPKMNPCNLDTAGSALKTPESGLFTYGQVLSNPSAKNLKTGKLFILSSKTTSCETVS